MKEGVFEKVYEIVKKIPRGKVATYGEVAKRVNSYWLSVGGKEIDARTVGWALHANRDPQVPCHRVVDRNGRLAPGFAFDGPKEQRRRLEAEGVKFVDDEHVDLEKSKI